MWNRVLALVVGLGALVVVAGCTVNEEGHHHHGRGDWHGHYEPAPRHHHHWH